MIADSHVHVGAFRGRYFPPEQVIAFLLRRGVSRFVVSATAAATGHHAEALRDLEHTIACAPNSVIPLLWVAPELLRCDPGLERALAALPYRGLKIHGRAHHWDPAGRPLRRVLAIARERRLPVLIHTGGDAACDAGAYARALRIESGTTAILAHGRPIDQTCDVLTTCPTAWVDTAFMPLQDLDRLMTCGLGDRVLFGSDVPIDRIFRRGDAARRYRSRLKTLRRRYGEEWFTLWTWTNHLTIWPP